MRSLASRRSTERPARAKTTAAARPFGPAPTTTASYDGLVVIGSRSRELTDGVALRPPFDRTPANPHQGPAPLAHLDARGLGNGTGGGERAALGHEVRFGRDDDALARRETQMAGSRGKSGENEEARTTDRNGDLAHQ